MVAREAAAAGNDVVDPILFLLVLVLVMMVAMLLFGIKRRDR